VPPFESLEGFRYRHIRRARTTTGFQTPSGTLTRRCPQATSVAPRCQSDLRLNPVTISRTSRPSLDQFFREANRK
jgi:hypothetical protein